MTGRVFALNCIPVLGSAETLIVSNCCILLQSHDDPDISALNQWTSRARIFSWSPHLKVDDFRHLGHQKVLTMLFQTNVYSQGSQIMILYTMEMKVNHSDL